MGVRIFLTRDQPIFLVVQVFGSNASPIQVELEDFANLDVYRCLVVLRCWASLSSILERLVVLDWALFLSPWTGSGPHSLG